MSEIKSLYEADAIRTRIVGMANEIHDAIPASFMIVGLLKGAFVFVADLARALSDRGADPEIEFMRLSSYGLGKQSAGEVHLLGDVPCNVAGREILLVDDILDTGRSIAYARTLLAQREAGPIWNCVLLDKPSRREVDVSPDFVGFTVPDVFVAGYGIDYAEKSRGLPFIGHVD